MKFGVVEKIILLCSIYAEILEKESNKSLVMKMKIVMMMNLKLYRSLFKQRIGKIIYIILKGIRMRKRYKNLNIKQKYFLL